MLDTVSTLKIKKQVQLPDLDALRLKRDRAIATEFVKRGESKTARSAIASEMGLNLRLVYRAIDKHLDWARSTTDQGQASAAGDADGECRR